MNEAQQTLYDPISQFTIGTGNEQLTFTGRLARDNGWTEAFAARVIDEYKRFAFLGVVAGHPVTPSDQVDQAWHLHLTYSQSYWDEFCGQVLETKFHHGPTRGGQGESHKFNEWYQRTLESYVRLFGQEPPPDIWPDAKSRFGHDLYFRRVNTKRNWVIRKPPFFRRSTTSRLAVLLTLGCLAFYLTYTALVDGDKLELMTSLGVRAKYADIFTNDFCSGAIVLAFVAILIANVFFKNRCPKCKQRWAMQRTGARKKGGWFKTGEEKWKCKYCGYRQWRSEDSDSGCGGCGGCGG